jgi:hypothetical protein
MRKAQVTAFVIVGIIILIVAGLIIFLSASTVNNDAEKRIMEAIQKKPYKIDVISSFIERCTSSAISKSIRSAREKAGYFQSEYPDNVIYFEGSYYVTAYDLDYDYVDGLPDEEDALDELELVAENALSGCAYSAYYNLLTENDTFETFLNETDTLITNNSVILRYTYTVVLNDETRQIRSTSMISTNMYYFINEANSLVQEFLESYNDPDPIFNEDVCESTYFTYSFKPEYPVDFMLRMDTSESRVKLGQNFFLVTFYKGNETLSFAVKPEPINPIC